MTGKISSAALKLSNKHIFEPSDGWRFTIIPTRFSNIQASSWLVEELMRGKSRVGCVTPPDPKKQRGGKCYHKLQEDKDMNTTKNVH